MTDQTAQRERVVPDEDVELTRRRFVRRRWARRWLAWRPLLAALLVLAMVAAGIWLVFFSRYLAVERTEVNGERMLTEQQVLGTAMVPMGRPLARVDIEAIRDRVRALAPVKDVDVTRTWPDGVRISMTERTAVAVVEIGGGLKGLDAGGVIFRDYAEKPSGLPTVRVDESEPEVLVEAARVISALPQSTAENVRYIELESIDQIELQMKGERRVIWGSAEETGTKAQVLTALLEARPKAKGYNVSAPAQPTTF